MAPERAYLIVSQVAMPGTRVTARTRFDGTDHSALTRPEPSRPGSDVPAQVRRHRAGRHRAGGPGIPGRHAARRPATMPGAALARYASLAVVLPMVLVSGWYAASGASAFAQLVAP